MHRVNSDIRILDDINSMVSVTDTQGELFKDNQTVRVIDQIGNDIAVLFSTKYLGTISMMRQEEHLSGLTSWHTTGNLKNQGDRELQRR